MFAGAEAIDAEVWAGAGKCAGGEIADFRLIDHGAGGDDSEVRENWVFWVEIGEGVFLVDGALDAAVDFILVGGAPIRGRWEGILFGRFFRGFFGDHGAQRVGFGRWLGNSKAVVGAGCLCLKSHAFLRNDCNSMTSEL